LKDFVSRIRPIDPKRVALIGHGPSAFTAVNAALADASAWPVAVAVAGLPTGLPAVKEGSRPRLLFEYAAADKLFSPAEASNWAFLLKKRIPGFESRELPGVDNPQAPAAGIEQAIEFFLGGSAAVPPVPEVPKK
jgi:hypothetical protein